MTLITSCIYCHRTILNQYWHDSCREIYKDDLLATIKLAIIAGGITDIPEEIKESIVNDTWLTKKESDDKEAVQETLQRKKQFWELTKSGYIQKAVAEWEKEHPDPDPVRF